MQVDALLEVAAGRKLEAGHLLLGEGAAAQRAGDCGRTGAALKSTHTCGGRGPFRSALGSEPVAAGKQGGAAAVVVQAVEADCAVHLGIIVADSVSWNIL